MPIEISSLAANGEITTNESTTGNTEGIHVVTIASLPGDEGTISVPTYPMIEVSSTDEAHAIVTISAIIVSRADIATSIPPILYYEMMSRSIAAVPTTEYDESSTFIPKTTRPIASSVLSITVFEATLMGVVLLLTLLIVVIMLMLCIRYIKKCKTKQKARKNNGVTGGGNHARPLEMKINEAYDTWGQDDGKVTDSTDLESQENSNIYEVIH